LDSDLAKIETELRAQRPIEETKGKKSTFLISSSCCSKRKEREKAYVSLIFGAWTLNFQLFSFLSHKKNEEMTGSLQGKEERSTLFS